MYILKILLPLSIISSSFASLEKCEYNSEYTKDLYSDYRSMVVESGWVPDKELIDKIGGLTQEEDDYLAKGWTELASCAGTGDGDCLFLFKSGHRKLKIITYNSPAYVKYVEVCDV